MSHEYRLTAHAGENLAQVSAQALESSLHSLTRAHDYDGRTKRGKDLNRALDLARQAKAIVDEYDGFKALAK